MLKGISNYFNSSKPSVCPAARPQRKGKGQLKAADRRTIKERTATGFPVDLITLPPDGLQKDRSLRAEYAFVVNADRISKIDKGWTVDIFNENVYKMCAPGPESMNYRWHIYALAGPSSVGKSHIAERLYLAHCEELGSVEKLKQTKDELQNSIKEGYGPTTIGISSIIVKDTIILDTAGKNAPVDRAKGATGTEDLELATADIRATEGILEHVVVDIADTIIYVVDETSNADQRAVINIIHQIKNKRVPQKLIILHNFKRMSPDGIGIEYHIEEQIINTFRAGPVTISKLERTAVGHDLTFWKSRWAFLDSSQGNSTSSNSDGQAAGATKEVEVSHFMMYNDDVEAGRLANNAVYRYLMLELSRTERRMVGSPIRAIAQSISDNLGHYLRERDIAEEEGGDGTANEKKSAAAEEKKEEVNEDEYPIGEMIIKAKVSPNKRLELLRWNIIEQPLGCSKGGIALNYSHFVDQDGNKDCIRFYCPGVPSNALKKEGDPVAPRQSYVRVSRRIIPENRMEYFYVIEGYRKPTEHDPSDNSFGKFRIEIPVQFAFFGQQEISFVNNVLWIKTHAVNNALLA